MKNRRNVLTNAGGGGPLLTGTSVQSVSGMSSRIYFGICPTIPVVRNVGQTLNQSCSTREKRHREKRGFRLVPLLGLAFTMAARLSRFHNGLVGLRSAFTMAEILLSLTIIGVVAAITLPSLTGNINERTWNTQRKALYARFSQAIALMPSLNGYGTLREITDSAGSTSIEDTAAETFVTSGLSKVLKINNICDSEHLKDCGLPEKLSTFAGSTITLPLKMSELNSIVVSTSNEASHSQIDTIAAGFETANGENIAVYYNPYCTSQMKQVNNDISMMPQGAICANFIYDLNGNKGPNSIGKDIGFLTVFYSTDPVAVAPYPNAQDATVSVANADMSNVCKKQDSEYRLPTKEELVSLWVNEKLLGNMKQDRYWSSSVNLTIDHPWYIRTANGAVSYLNEHMSMAARCIKR